MLVPETVLFWYVMRIKPKHDKMSAYLLNKMGIPCYLPLQKQSRQWSDRRKWIEVPVLSPYLFVKISAAERNNVFNAPGVLSYLRYNGDYAKVSHEELKVLKEICDGIEPLNLIRSDFQKNEVVQICSGPFEGIQAQVIEARKSKVLLSLQGIGSIVECEMTVNYIKKVS